MAVFRKVHTEFWKDPKVLEEMTPEDKYFMLYLLTNPNTTQIGIYQISIKTMAFELGYSMESITSLMDRFINNHKIIKYNKETREIAIKNWGKYNLNRAGKPMEDCVKSELKEVKDLTLIEYVAEEVKSANLKALYDTYTIREYKSTIRTQEEEEEEEEEKEEEKEQDKDKEPKKTTAAFLKNLIEEWNDIGLPSKLTKITKNTSRFNMIYARVQEYGEEEVMSAVRGVKESSFLQGHNSKGWIITFDWFIKPNNFIKVLEGNYINKEAPCGKTQDRGDKPDPFAKFYAK